MAAGLGTRMRPLTEAFAKPVLPVDGRPVLATLLRELASAGISTVYLVTGHLAHQLEALVGDGRAFGLDVRVVPQPQALGSGDAVARALAAGARPPVLVVAADNVFGRGDVGRFVRRWRESGTDGAVAWRPPTERSAAKGRIDVSDGIVVRVPAREATGAYVAAPLWVLGPGPAGRLRDDEQPWELSRAVQASIDAGERVAAIEIGETRDLTSPVDLLRENFAYLEGLERGG